MKTVATPDFFKENLTSMEAADFAEAGIRKADENIEVMKVPVSDNFSSMR